MIILHTEPSARVFLPISRREWMPTSEHIPLDGAGNPTFYMCWDVYARTRYGKEVWRGKFEDREDADAFLFSAVSGSLIYERELWDLPMPMWDPEFWRGFIYAVDTKTFITATTAGLSYTKPADWNDADNNIHVLGGGGGGSAVTHEGEDDQGTPGGGGGAYRYVDNATIAGSTTPYKVGTGGAQVNDSNSGPAGGQTWFGGATALLSLVAANGGSGGVKDSDSGGPGGTIAGLPGTGGNLGGRGGNSSAGSNQATATGGGGAGGPNAAGGVGGICDAQESSVGGAGGGPNGGAGGPNSGAAGGAGTTWSSSPNYGTGGGGHGEVGGSSATGGTGGNYGGGGGAGNAYNFTSASSSSGAGKQGMIYIRYTPRTSFPFAHSPSLIF